MEAFPPPPCTGSTVAIVQPIVNPADAVLEVVAIAVLVVAIVLVVAVVTPFASDAFEATLAVVVTVVAPSSVASLEISLATCFAAYFSPWRHPASEEGMQSSFPS